MSATNPGFNGNFGGNPFAALMGGANGAPGQELVDMQNQPGLGNMMGFDLQQQLASQMNMNYQQMYTANMMAMAA